MVRTRKSIKPSIVFQESDVLVLNYHPASETDNSLAVIAILVPFNHESLKTERTRRVINKQNLCKLIWQARRLINRYMKGPLLIQLDGQTQPSCMEHDGMDSQEQRQKKDSKQTATTISVSVLGAVVLLLVAFLAVFCIR